MLDVRKYENPRILRRLEKYLYTDIKKEIIYENKTEVYYTYAYGNNDSLHITFR